MPEANKYRNIDQIIVIENVLDDSVLNALLQHPVPENTFRMAVQNIVNIAMNFNSSVFKFNLSGYNDFKITTNSGIDLWQIDLERERSSSIRKLKLICILNSSSEEAIFFDPPRKPPVFQKAGELIIFPAFLQYRFNKNATNMRILSGFLIGHHFR